MSEELTSNLPDDGVRLILTRFDSLDARMTGLEGRMTGLEERMTALEEKVDRRLQETRPIWEQVLARLTRIETRLTSVEGEVYDLNRKFRVFNVDIVKLQDKQDDLTERVRRLEPETAP